jgi:hypothetical protein
MMATALEAFAGPRHPSPQREGLSSWLLLFALAGGPAAWGAQLLAAYGLASLACGQIARSPSASPGWIEGVSAATVVLALAAALAGWNAWRATREERGGRGVRLLETGEGRTRFLGLAGLMLALGSAGAIVFDSVGLLTLAPC